MAPQTDVPLSFARGLSMLIIGAVALGFAPIFVRWSEVGTSATGFWRLALALPFMIAWHSFEQGGTARPVRPAQHRLVALAGVFFAADLAVWHVSICTTSVANAALETNLSAVIVPLFAWLILKERMSISFGGAVFLAFAGVVLLVGSNVHLSAKTLYGDMLGVLSAFFYSGYLLAVKSARDRGVSAVSVMIVSGAIAALILLIIALMTDQVVLPATFRGGLILLGLAIVSQLGGQLLVAYSLVALPASLASLGLLVQPATAVVAAWLLLGESLSPRQFVGAGLLLVGLWLGSRSAPASPRSCD